MTWGEQTDVPESADWYNAGYLLIWGSNVPQTRTPDAHFYTEVRYKGTKSAVISPDYAEATKFADLWLHPKQGTDAALAMAMGHVILREFHLDRTVPYFQDYIRRYTDLPMLVRLVRKDGRYVPGPPGARRRLRRRAGRDEQSRMEDRGIGRRRQPGRPARFGRLPLGRAGQVESGTAARRWRGNVAAAQPDRRRRDGRGGVSLFRRRRDQWLHRDRASRCRDAQRSGAQPRR